MKIYSLKTFKNQKRRSRGVRQAKTRQLIHNKTAASSGSLLTPNLNYHQTSSNQPFVNFSFHNPKTPPPNAIRFNKKTRISNFLCHPSCRALWQRVIWGVALICFNLHGVLPAPTESAKPIKIRSSSNSKDPKLLCFSLPVED